MSERDKNDYALGINLQASRGNQFLQGAQNAVRLDIPTIPTPEEIKAQRAAKIEGEVSRLCVRLRAEIRDAMQNGLVTAHISFESTFDVAIEVAKRIEKEVKAAGWEDVSTRRSNSHVQISWRQPPEVSEAL